MFHATRSTTTPGRTALVLLALAALLLSLFSLAGPVLAEHATADGPEVAAARNLARENNGGNITACPAGKTLVRFETAGTGGSSGGVTYTITAGKLTFTTSGVLVVEALIKGGAGTNIYDYSGATTGFAGPGIAHDDGLVGPLGAISNVGFCVITQPTGDLLINKTGANGALAGVTFTLTGTGFTTQTDVTDAQGKANFDDLVPGTYTLTETTPAGYQANGPWTVTVSATGVVSIAGLTANQDGSFNITNTLITGDLLINKTGANGALAGVTFTLTGTGFTTQTDVTDAQGKANFDDLVPGTYTLTETTPAGYQANGPWTVTVSATGVVSIAGLTANQDGSFNITNTEAPDLILNKVQVSECEICDAFTPGFYFNRSAHGETPGNEVADRLLGDSPITIDGTTFDSVDDVHTYLDADIDGADGKKGLSADGQLVRHYLALQLNVWYADEGDCDLGALMVDDTRTVQDLLDAAEELLGGAHTDAQARELKDDIAAVNESDPGDGTLTCPDDAEQGEATALEGVTFTLVNEELEYDESFETDDAGRVTFPDLEDGTYTLTESGAPADCETAGPWTVVVENGEITVFVGDVEDDEELTADEDGSFTIVNECDDTGGGGDETGEIIVVKDDLTDSGDEFVFEATYDNEGFTLSDDGTNEGDEDRNESGPIDAEEEHVITEAVEGDWELTDVECVSDGDSTFERVGDSAKVVLAEGDTVTCTFTNDLEEEEEDTGRIKIFKTMCTEIGQQNTCNGPGDTSLNGYQIDFEIYAGTGTSGTLVDTITVTLGENEQGQGNLGDGSFGKIDSDDLDAGTYTVCEVPVAYLDDDEVDLVVTPRPEAGDGGSTGGQQTLFGDNCIVVEVKKGTATVKFLDQKDEEEEADTGTIVIDKVVTGTGASGTEDFAITLTGQTVLALSANDPAVSFEIEIDAEDTYTVSEALTALQNAAGWTLTGIVCTSDENGVLPDAIGFTLEADETVTCVVTNNFAAPLVPTPGLVIDKVASTETITITGAPGALVATPSIVTWTLSYTLVNGPVTGAVITDPLPAGFTFIDASNGGSLIGNTVTWNLGTVNASGSVTFRTTVNPVTVARGTVTNTATIDSNETAPDTGQDSVTVSQTGTQASVSTPAPTPVVRTGTATSTGVPNTATSTDAGLTAAAMLGSTDAAERRGVRVRSHGKRAPTPVAQPRKPTARALVRTGALALSIVVVGGAPGASRRTTRIGMASGRSRPSAHGGIGSAPPAGSRTRPSRGTRAPGSAGRGSRIGGSRGRA